MLLCGWLTEEWVVHRRDGRARPLETGCSDAEQPCLRRRRCEWSR
jgi:hypothetical protein